MFGVMIVLAMVLSAVVPVVLAVLAVFAVPAAVFSALSALLAGGVTFEEGLVPGVILGFLLVLYLRKIRAAKKAA